MKFFGRKTRVTVDDKQFDLRIKFSVEKNSEIFANKASIGIFNLSADSRGYIERGRRIVRLEAGYEESFALIFVGDISKVTNQRQGADIITTLECGDGEIALRTAKLDVSFREGATEAEVANAAINAFVALGVRLGPIETIQSKVYSGGFCFSGPASQILDEITKTQGLEWNIQNGVLQILKIGAATKDTAVLLSASSGLIGFPTKTDNGFQAKSLLNPELNPGRVVALESQQLSLSGQYRVVKLKHEGDSHEGDFMTDLEGEKIGG